MLSTFKFHQLNLKFGLLVNFNSRTAIFIYFRWFDQWAVSVIVGGSATWQETRLTCWFGYVLICNFLTFWLFAQFVWLTTFWCCWGVICYFSFKPRLLWYTLIVLYFGNRSSLCIFSFVFCTLLRCVAFFFHESWLITEIVCISSWNIFRLKLIFIKGFGWFFQEYFYGEVINVPTTINH